MQSYSWRCETTPRRCHREYLWYQRRTWESSELLKSILSQKDGRYYLHLRSIWPNIDPDGKTYEGPDEILEVLSGPSYDLSSWRHSLKLSCHIWEKRPLKPKYDSWPLSWMETWMRGSPSTLSRSYTSSLYNYRGPPLIYCRHLLEINLTNVYCSLAVHRLWDLRLLLQRFSSITLGPYCLWLRRCWPFLLSVLWRERLAQLSQLYVSILENWNGVSDDNVDLWWSWELGDVWLLAITGELSKTSVLIRSIKSALLAIHWVIKYTNMSQCNYVSKFSLRNESSNPAATTCGNTYLNE